MTPLETTPLTTETPIDPLDPERLFSYHRPSEANVDKIRELRQLHRELAADIIQLVPPSPERALALRALHLCSMHTNCALVQYDPIAD